jgi:SAM-dependent methyltransferase
MDELSRPRIGITDRPTDSGAINPSLRQRLSALRERFFEGKEAVERCLGASSERWARVIMDRESKRFVESLDCSDKDALEISGVRWKTHPFRSYANAWYPDYDICAGTLDRTYDIIILEQVLEHVLWPTRAVSNIWKMLRPGGFFIVNTPFLIRIHDVPLDCSRWSELGLKHLLLDAGFDRIKTGSWGNRACVRANFRRWRQFNPWLHSLRNERLYPVSVWAFAQKHGG